MDSTTFISSHLKFKGKAAFWATAVSAFVMVVAVCVSGGFRSAIRDAVRSKASDAIIHPAGTGVYDGSSSMSARAALSSIQGIPGIVEARPVIYKAGAIKGASYLEGVVFKGADTTGRLCARIGTVMAKKLGVVQGDVVTSYFLSDKPKARNFTVAQITSDGSDLSDAPVVECPLADLQRLNGWDADEVSAVELFFDKAGPDEARAKAAEISFALYDSGLCCTASCEYYHTIFEWLDMINANVLAILVLMSIVAAFNMISALLIMLSRSVSTIGTLKALGMTSGGIGRVYLRISSAQVLRGLAAGAGAGVAVCLIQKFTHVFKLDPANYFVSFVPIQINIPEIVLTGIFAWLAIMGLLLIPCRYISKIDPASTIKAD